MVSLRRSRHAQENFLNQNETLLQQLIWQTEVDRRRQIATDARTFGENDFNEKLAAYKAFIAVPFKRDVIFYDKSQQPSMQLSSNNNTPQQCDKNTAQKSFSSTTSLFKAISPSTLFRKALLKLLTRRKICISCADISSQILRLSY